MAYYVFFRSDNGELVSEGSVVPPTLPEGVEAMDVGTRPDHENVRWDAATRSFIAKPPVAMVDRLDDLNARFLADPDFSAVWATLNATRRTQLRDGLRRVLGGVLRDMRYRPENEGIEL